MKKLRDKIKKIILGYGSPCGFDLDGASIELDSLFKTKLTKELVGMRMEKRKTFNLVYDGGFNQAVKEQNTKIEKRLRKLEEK